MSREYPKVSRQHSGLGSGPSNRDYSKGSVTHEGSGGGARAIFSGAIGGSGAGKSYTKTPGEERARGGYKHSMSVQGFAKGGKVDAGAVGASGINMLASPQAVKMASNGQSGGQTGGQTGKGTKPSPNKGALNMSAPTPMSPTIPTTPVTPTPPPTSTTPPVGTIGTGLGGTGTTAPVGGGSVGIPGGETVTNVGTGGAQTMGGNGAQTRSDIGEGTYNGPDGAANDPSVGEFMDTPAGSMSPGAGYGDNGPYSPGQMGYGFQPGYYTNGFSMVDLPPGQDLYGRPVGPAPAPAPAPPPVTLPVSRPGIDKWGFPNLPNVPIATRPTGQPTGQPSYGGGPAEGSDPYGYGGMAGAGYGNTDYGVGSQGYYEAQQAQYNNDPNYSGTNYNGSNSGGSGSGGTSSGGGGDYGGGGVDPSGMGSSEDAGD